MSSIVAIGGGEFKSRGTLNIDRMIVKTSGKERPRVLFIPTASQESGGYITTFRHVYGQDLGCKTQPLMLGKGTPKSRDQVMDIVMGADIIYVGGGNTRYMLDIWNKFGVDEALIAAGREEKILCGLSAGALCWFEGGWSDYELLEGGSDYRLLPALGIVPGILCPHYDQPGRAEGLAQCVNHTGKPAICLSDYAALVINHGRYEVLLAQPEASAMILKPNELPKPLAMTGDWNDLGLERGVCNAT
jgi:dipeptidase E